MANRIKIEITSLPTNFNLLAFSVFNSALGYSKIFSKTFITGVPTAPNQVQISSDFNTTMTRLLNNLIANDTDGNVLFSLGTNGITGSLIFLYIDFVQPQTYSYNIFTNDVFAVFSTETVTVPANDVLDDLLIKHFQILIYDTYQNDLPLVVEKTAKSACQLSFDGGDDLYKTFVASKLVFNMLVANYEDAFFIHLFTGDEQRYRVELNAIDEDDNVQLVWQGFILPDQHDEPYENNGLFVDFTASDMLSSLKGKYFEPWYYNNKLPITEVIALALKNTGLEQDLLVKPVLLPASPLIPWHYINVDLRDFVDNDKYKDCYEILEKVLSSQGLSIYNFRGFWWLEGISRKHEKNNTALRFDSDGKKLLDIDLSKKELTVLMQANAPVVKSITPWRAVNLNFKPNGTTNLFSEQVVKIPQKEQFYSNYVSPGYTGIVPAAFEVYNMVKINRWIENFNGEFFVPTYKINDTYSSSFYAQIFWQRNNPLSNYNYNEAAVLNRWIECAEKPYIKPGILYEFDMEFSIDNLVVYLNQNTFKQNLKTGYYDKLFPFQIFVNGVEKFSNRPSFVNTVNLRYEVQETNNGSNVYKLVFKLKFNFNSDVEGQLSFRLLMPINMSSQGGLQDIDFFRGFIDVLKLTAIEGYDEKTDVIASRNVNYTQELDYDLGITCTIDKSVLNSFGLGYPIDDDYFEVIDRSVNNADITTNHYFAPATNLELVYNRWDVLPSLIELLFEKGVVKSVFKEDLAGNRIPFTSLWYHLKTPASRIGYLKSVMGFPVIPKKYKTYPSVLTSDVIKYMHVKYNEENFANRLDWSLNSSTVVDTYPKTLARALHAVQPEHLYRLDAVHYGVVFPNDLLVFYYNNEDRDFIPTRIVIDLFNAKTTFTATEAKFVDLEENIIYE